MLSQRLPARGPGRAGGPLHSGTAQWRTLASNKPGHRTRAPGPQASSERTLVGPDRHGAGGDHRPSHAGQPDSKANPKCQPNSEREKKNRVSPTGNHWHTFAW